MVWPSPDCGAPGNGGGGGGSGRGSPGFFLAFFFLPIAPVESKPVSPAPDGGTISFAVASGVDPAIARVVGAEVLKRCTFCGSVSEGWNGEVPAPWARACTTIERW